MTITSDIAITVEQCH